MFSINIYLNEIILTICTYIYKFFLLVILLFLNKILTREYKNIICIFFNNLNMFRNLMTQLLFFKNKLGFIMFDDGDEDIINNYYYN